MTWSVIGRDADSGAIGAAVSSRFFAVGAVVPHVATGVGAACTQALLNPYYGPRALVMMREGEDARAVLDALIGADGASVERQLHLMSADGAVAAFTGTGCVEHAGHRAAPDVSVAGNMLAGPEVLDATLDAFVSSAGRPLAERLLRALSAGEEAGGDKRGKQAAAIVVHGVETYADLDLRVDDHAEPIAELWRLYQVAHERHLAYRAFMPRRDDPVGVRSRDQLDALIDQWLGVHGRPDFSEFFSRDSSD